MRTVLAIMAILMVFMAVVAAKTVQAQMDTTLRANLSPVASAPVPIDTATAQATNATNAGRAGGSAVLTLDRTSRVLRWQVNYSGLSSDAVEAHIHTLAGPGVTPVIIVNLGKHGMGSPLIGSTTLDDTQIADLVAGRNIVDVHTKLNQGGEISGQITP